MEFRSFVRSSWLFLEEPAVPCIPTVACISIEGYGGKYCFGTNVEPVCLEAIVKMLHINKISRTIALPGNTLELLS